MIQPQMPNWRQWMPFVARETESSISTNDEDSLHQTVVQMLIHISFFSLEDWEGLASDQQGIRTAHEFLILKMYH